MSYPIAGADCACAFACAAHLRLCVGLCCTLRCERMPLPYVYVIQGPCRALHPHLCAFLPLVSHGSPAINRVRVRSGGALLNALHNSRCIPGQAWRLLACAALTHLFWPLPRGLYAPALLAFVLLQYISGPECMISGSLLVVGVYIPPRAPRLADSHVHPRVGRSMHCHALLAVYNCRQAILCSAMGDCLYMGHGA